MEEVVSELRQLQIRLDEINARQAELDTAIADNQAKLAEEKANLERRMNIFKKRLRDIYINGQINYLDVLLGAKDFSMDRLTIWTYFWVRRIFPTFRPVCSCCKK